MKNTTWPWVAIGDLFEIGAGKTMSQAAREGDGRIPFLRTSNVLWDEIDLSVLDEMALSSAELSHKCVAKGDLLVCEGGDIGRAAVWDGDLSPLAFQNHLHRLRPRRADVDPRFYVYFLQSAFTQLGIFEGAGNKTTIPNLSRNRLASLEVPHPPPQEQRTIAQTLALVRGAGRGHKRAATRAEELKQAAMRELFTCGVRRGPQAETEFGPIPQRWGVVPLDQVALVQTGTAKGRKLRGEADVLVVPYLRVANVQDGHLDLGELKTIPIRRTELDRYLLRGGDVLLTEGGDFDKLGRGFIWRGEVQPCIHQNHVFAVRVNRERLLPEFLAYLAQSSYGKAYFLKVAHKTTNLACINTAKLKALPVPVPSVEEQRDIVGVLGAIDRKIDLHRRKRALLEELFSSLLYKLMTGALRPSELSPCPPALTATA